MDILYSLSSLLADALDERRRTHLDYRDLCSLEERLLALLSQAAGEELVEKLTAAQAERLDVERLFSFLQGLRLGVELLGLQGS